MESKIQNTFLTNQQRLLLLKMGLYLGIDILYAVLFASFLMANDTIISGYLPFISISFISLFGILAIWIRKGHANTFMLYGALLLLLAAGIFLFSLPIWFITLMLIYLHWRISSYFQTKDVQIEVASSTVTLFLSLSALSFVIGNARDLENKMLIIFLVILLFTLIAAVTSVQRMLNGAKGSGDNRNKQLKKPFVIILFVILAGVVLSYTSTFIRTVIYWVLSKVFWLFSFLVDPIYGFLVKVRDWLLSRVSRDTLSGMGLKFNENVEQVQQQATSDGMSWAWFNEVLMILFVIAIIIYFLKKRKVPYEESTGEVIPVIMNKFTSISKKVEKEFNGGTYTDAENAIRHAVKELESAASTVGKGRENNENIRAWFARLGILEDESFFTLYESVRYGTRIPEKLAVENFTHSIEKHISYIKEDNGE
ncbi:hypothetical protein LCM10_16755 [Rossellomorea aquimaris]|uniref:hypothetical protein n=1 Tax=Rossellomorea aquimaris TaxID=189382 RepID=UPI001CD7A280|nr:hypothetical protein [Rossellomorea aquimaris]MCA1056635.1 hypothetical protein [Rossellomorea aquimaris]